MRIAVIGATGVLGRHVVPRLVERGHSVSALVRDDGARALLAATGAETRFGDIVEAATLAPVVEGCDAAMHLATVIPKPGGPADWDLNARVRVDGTRNLVAACAATGVRRYVQQSIAHLANAEGDGWLDETAPLNTSPHTESSVEMEDIVRASGLEWWILRGGSFYGPGSGYPEAWCEQARQGELRLPGDGRGWISPVHVADMAAACIAAAEADGAGELVNVVDDNPVRWADYLGHAAALAGAPPPAPGGPPGLPSYRASNRRAKEALGWRPFYAGHRAGMA